jgi:hypothetical protein
MKYFILFICFSVCSACTHQPDLSGFDAQAFKQDRGACGGKRGQQISWLKSHKMNFKGVSSNNMEEILGKPDIQQLADRNQEYYIYFLEPGTQCDHQPSQAKSIAFRFSAIGLATEITFQEGVPL